MIACDCETNLLPWELCLNAWRRRLDNSGTFPEDLNVFVLHFKRCEWAVLEGLWESPQTDDDPGIETLPVRSGVLGVPDMMTLLWWIKYFY